MPDRLDTLYLALLSRYPTPDEVDLLLPRLESADPAAAFQDISYALINTQQFLFVQ